MATMGLEMCWPGLASNEALVIGFDKNQELVSWPFLICVTYCATTSYLDNLQRWEDTVTRG